jgi:hypothetical protein
MAWLNCASLSLDTNDRTVMEPISKSTERSCKNCRYVLLSDTAESGLRCGWDYFQNPPLERKVRRMSQFAELEPVDFCDKWKAKE